MIDWHEWNRYWHKRMPILDWLPQYNLKRDLKFDFIAGFTVAVMLVPQEMSFAAVMGVPAQYGLYTAAIAPLLYPLFGTSRALSVANAAEGSLLVGVMLRSADIRSTEERVATGILMTFFTGLIMICSGFLHQGGIVSFFSRTSMNGYITATAFLIITSQMPGWFGITLHKTAPLSIFTLIEIISELPNANAYSVALGIFSLSFLSVTKTLKAQLQGISKLESTAVVDSAIPTATVVDDEDDEADNDQVVEVYVQETDTTDTTNRSATAAVRPAATRRVGTQAAKPSPLPVSLSIIQQFLLPRPFIRQLCSMVCDGSALAVCVIGMLVGATLREGAIKVTGVVPSGLPSPVFPPMALGSTLPWDRLQAIVINSLMIAVIFFMSSVATGSKLANKDGYEISPNQELLGLGFANLGASFFQGMPSTAGMSRSAVNSQSAHTPLASMITATLVILTLLFLTGPLYYLPQAPLAAIILLSAVSLIDFAEPKWLRKVKKNEFYVWLMAFTGTLALGLLRGLGISIVASLLAIMASSKKPKVSVLGQREDGVFVDVATGAAPLQDVVVVRMEHALYFGNTSHFVHGVERALQAAKANGRVLGAVVDGSRMNEVDASAIHALVDYSHKLAARDQQLTFANMREDTAASLEASGLWTGSSDERKLTGDIATAVAFVRRPYAVPKPSSNR